NLHKSRGLRAQRSYVNSTPGGRHMSRSVGRRLSLCVAGVLVAILIPAIARGDITELVPGTAILLDQSSGSGSGGNSKSTSSSTNIFSPAAFVDYKRFGGEPTAVVDRYSFSNGQFGCTNATCPPRDLVYTSSPQGLVQPHYSTFYKSDDLGQTFRVPTHTPFTALGTGNG